jgi:hypothetical protein
VDGKKTCFEQIPEKKNGTAQITPEKKPIPAPVNGNQL